MSRKYGCIYWRDIARAIPGNCQLLAGQFDLKNIFLERDWNIRLNNVRSTVYIGAFCGINLNTSKLEEEKIGSRLIEFHNDTIA